MGDRCGSHEEHRLERGECLRQILEQVLRILAASAQTNEAVRDRIPSPACPSFCRGVNPAKTRSLRIPPRIIEPASTILPHFLDHEEALKQGHNVFPFSWHSQKS
jgi:hypothetical protein